MKGEDADSFDPNALVEVLKPNWDAVMVYSECRLEVAVGMSALLWIGINQTNIQAAATMLRIDPDKWPWILRAVNYIASVVCNHRNKVKDGGSS